MFFVSRTTHLTRFQISCHTRTIWTDLVYFCQMSWHSGVYMKLKSRSLNRWNEWKNPSSLTHFIWLNVIWAHEQVKFIFHLSKSLCALYCFAQPGIWSVNAREHTHGRIALSPNSYHSHSKQRQWEMKQQLAQLKLKCARQTIPLNGFVLFGWTSIVILRAILNCNRLLQ